MNIITTIEDIRTVIRNARKNDQRIAFVPTMGNLHEGHLTLVRKARQHADVVIASIFVNPIQFGPNEDFEKYPRTLEADRSLLEAEACDALFLPNVTTLYPNGSTDLTTIHVPKVSEGLCAATRPNHFDGVSTVVGLLFNIVQPDVALFGKKDYQQLAIIKKMVSDLHMPIEVIGIDTVRESTGLARSSRNGYLTEEQHAQAALLYERLQETAAKLKAGSLIEPVLEEAKQQLVMDGFKIDYLELRQRDLSPMIHTTDNPKEAVLLAAAYLGQTRLLDNVMVPFDQQ